MSVPIEDYALIGDCHTGALVSRAGSIDWLCLPRFDSGACFAALLGTSDHGHWSIAPKDEKPTVRRHYRDETLILETDFETAEGKVTVVDFMPPRTAQPDIIRRVIGRQGRVPMRLELVLRPDYGSVVPWVRRRNGGISAIAGPDGFHFHSDVELHGEGFKTVGDFSVAEEETVSFNLTWFPSHEKPPKPADPVQSLEITEAWWRKWSERCRYRTRWPEAMIRSLITLKALTYAPTGGIVAARTTSLPERLGGTRNWDYRCCWPRDATFTLHALLESGYIAEARAWRNWLLRAVAGSPDQIQSVYGIAGEHRLTELELPWLPGYESSAPVRVGNDAYTQLQLDVYGEIMATLYLGRSKRLPADENAWRMQSVLMKHLQAIWREADRGIWEVRGDPQQFTHSKVMAWVAADRAVRTIERFGENGPLEAWRKLRDTIHAEVCAKGFDPHLKSFVQHYGSRELDASLLMIPMVGFLPADDARVAGTVAAIQKHLVRDGLVMRYETATSVDGLVPGEGVFLLCTFWLVDNLIFLGRLEEARRLFESLLALRNDVGLLSEEYDVRGKRLLGNFPQAFSHVALVNSARRLSKALEGKAPSKKSGPADTAPPAVAEQ